MTGFILEQCRHYKPQAGKGSYYLHLTLHLDRFPECFAAYESSFLPPPCCPLCSWWLCRPASPDLQRRFRALIVILYCRGMAGSLKGTQPGHNFVRKTRQTFLLLPYTCLWVTQPLSARLRPAWLALGAHPVPKSRPAAIL